MLISDLKQHLVAAIQSSGKPAHGLFSSDMPLVLLDFLQEVILNKIIYARGFQASEPIQNKVRAVIQRLLGPWQGPNVQHAVKMLEMQIDDAKMSHRNSAFGWYVNQVSPVLTARAEAEVERSFVFDTDRRPMTFAVGEFIQ